MSLLCSGRQPFAEVCHNGLSSSLQLRGSVRIQEVFCQFSAVPPPGGSAESFDVRPSSHQKGVQLLFSAAPFPGYQRKLTRLREEFGGQWYATDEPEMESWLCPAMFRYFDEAPEEIYVKAEPKRNPDLQ